MILDVTSLVKLISHLWIWIVGLCDWAWSYSLV